MWTNLKNIHIPLDFWPNFKPILFNYIGNRRRTLIPVNMYFLTLESASVAIILASIAATCLPQCGPSDSASCVKMFNVVVT